MKQHQIIFERIKAILKKNFGKELSELEEGKNLSIGKSGIWISSDNSELTIGYGINHKHFNPEYDDMNEAIETFFNLLTKKKRITKYYKGTFQFKNKIEVESENNEFHELGISLNWFFPFWKKTKEEVLIENGIIEYSLLEKEFLNLKNSF